MLAWDEAEDPARDEAVLGLGRLEADVRDDHLAALEATRCDDVPDLAPVHRHGQLRSNRNPGDLARVGVHPGGKVDRDDGTP